MRFLFVYQDFATQARNLVGELLVRDVQVVVARKGEVFPNAAEIEMLKKHPGAEAAACQLNRKYRKNVEQYVSFTVAPKKFRFGDQVLREWLVPSDQQADAVAAPSAAFREADRVSALLRLHSRALDRSDDLDPTRWSFAAAAANLLARLASGEDLGPLREWGERHGVAFAANGQVRYRWTLRHDGEFSDGVSEWHLKAGDKTTAERAARIYFQPVDVGGQKLVLVFYVGPHPQDGVDSLEF